MNNSSHNANGHRSALRANGIIGLTAFALATSFAAASFDASEFASKKSIEFDSGAGDTLVAVPFDAEVYDSVRPGTPDIRVVSGSDVEVPFLIEKAIETRTRVTEKIARGKVDSLRELPGNRIEMTIILDDDAPNADVLRIHTPLSDYERRVTVFGSPDGEQWEQLANGALVFDYSRYFDIENKDVELPDNEHRNFRIVIEGIVDEKASPFRTLWLRSRSGEEFEHSEGFSVRNRPFRIDRIDMWARNQRESFESERIREYPVKGFTVNRDEEEKVTIVEIENGGEPLTKISVGTPDRNFSRRARVEVKKQVYATTEWVEISSATLTAIDYLEYDKEALSLSFPEHRHFLYRLIIEDQDNAPLEIASITGEGRIYQVVFIGHPDTAYELFYDSEKAEIPKYDIATVLAPIRHTYKPVTGALGAETINPHYNEEGDKAPFRLFENKVFLTAAIAAMVLILGWAVFSTSRKI